MSSETSRAELGLRTSRTTPLEYEPRCARPNAELTLSSLPEYLERVTIMRFTALLLVAIGLSTGCEENAEQSDPDDVFMAFLTHYFRGEPEKAFEYVAPEDRAVLQKPLEDAPNVGEKLEPWEMLVVAEVENIYDVAKITPMEELGDSVADGRTVRLKVLRTDGSETTASMVKRDGRWYVDLPLGTTGTVGKQG